MRAVFQGIKLRQRIAPNVVLLQFYFLLRKCTRPILGGNQRAPALIIVFINAIAAKGQRFGIFLRGLLLAGLRGHFEQQRAPFVRHALLMPGQRLFQTLYQQTLGLRPLLPRHQLINGNAPHFGNAQMILQPFFRLRRINKCQHFIFAQNQALPLIAVALQARVLRVEPSQHGIGATRFA